jgi:dimethylglycine dehydrogenase
VRLKKPDFIGKEGLLAIKRKGLRTRMCALTMDAGGNLYGGGGAVHAGGRMVDRIRTGSYGHTIGKDIGLVCLPPELAKAGSALEVEIVGERVKAQVADLPLVDPKGEKIRA